MGEKSNAAVVERPAAVGDAEQSVVSYSARLRNPSPSFDSYESFIAEQAEGARLGRPSRIINNRSSAHAEILIRYLISTAERELLILSGCLNESVFGSPKILEASKGFLLKGGSLRILLDWKPLHQKIPVPELSKEHSLLAMIDGLEASGSIEPGASQVVSVPPAVAKLYGFHFLVADRSSYRFEEDRTRFDAIAQFGNPDLAGPLASRFDEIWNLSLADAN